MIQIGLGGWLTCRIWDGMRSLGTVWRIGRSPMEYSMEHSVSRTVVISECSPPPMCGLGRSEGFWRIAPLVIVPTVAVAVAVVRIHDKARPSVRLS